MIQNIIDHVLIKGMFQVYLYNRIYFIFSYAHVTVYLILLIQTCYFMDKSKFTYNSNLNYRTLTLILFERFKCQ